MDEPGKPAATDQPAVTDKAGSDTTVSAEEFRQLKESYEAVKKAQTGSDQKVAQLLEALKQTDTTKRTAEERIAALEREAQEAKAQAEHERWLSAGYKLAGEMGLPGDLVNDYGGPRDELKSFLQKIKARDDEIAKKVANELLAKSHKPAASAPGHVESVNTSAMSKDEKMRFYEAEAMKRMGMKE